MEQMLKESAVLSNILNKCMEENWGITSVEIYKVFQNIFKSVYEFLNLNKNKEQKVSLVFPDREGNFILAGMIEYHKADDEDEVAGNWSFVYTFDQEDVKDGEIRYANEPQFLTIMNDIGYKCMSDVVGPAGFMIEPEDLILLLDVLPRYLKITLDQAELAEGETLDILLEDHFKASVTIENGIKYMSMVPCGLAKSKIKNDDLVESEEEL